ncbi:hypothetical protein evm_000162 [Chilo suppressalis]|nr:hypothetical protein evm_000162 [Chilo suppressalis]
MSHKYLTISFSAIFIQCVLGQVIPIPTTSFVTTNAVNNVELGNIGLNIANSGSNLANIGLGLANAGLSAIGNAGVVTGSVANTGTVIGGLTGLDVVSSGPLVVTSISPIGPSGIAVASENVIEGVLNVSGQLPYLSAVSFEGVLPTAGSGVATCGCGSGSIGIINA